MLAMSKWIRAKLLSWYDRPILAAMIDSYWESVRTGKIPRGHAIYFNPIGIAEALKRKPKSVLRSLLRLAEEKKVLRGGPDGKTWTVAPDELIGN